MDEILSIVKFMKRTLDNLNFYNRIYCDTPDLIGHITIMTAIILMKRDNSTMSVTLITLVPAINKNAIRVTPRGPPSQNKM